MESQQIIYPAIAMFLLTSIMIMSLGISRFIAIKKKQVSIRYYRLYIEGSQPERLHVLGRHVQNHFEVPPIFYAGILFTYVTDCVTSIGIYAAWCFVVLRFLHTTIHLGSNNVSKRFFCFGTSMIALAVLWISFAIELLQKS